MVVTFLVGEVMGGTELRGCADCDTMMGGIGGGEWIVGRQARSLSVVRS